MNPPVYLRITYRRQFGGFLWDFGLFCEIKLGPLSFKDVHSYIRAILFQLFALLEHHFYLGSYFSMSLLFLSHLLGKTEKSLF